jgi:hypothetical protein
MLVLDILFDWVGYRTARYLLPAITFGRVRADDITSSRSGFNWLGLQREGSGELLFSATMASWIGVLFWVLLLIAVLAFR